MIYGHSLGGAIAIDLALKHPDAFGMIVDASFTSMSEMAQLDSKYRIFPIDLLIHQRFDAIAKVRSLAIPVLYIHGTADELIPAAMAQRLYEATPTRKQIVLPNKSIPSDEQLLASLDKTAKQSSEKNTVVKVNPKSLLSQVDGELELTFREKVINKIAKNYKEVKVALANRNNE